ncbi:MAG: TonB-dependent receptor [Saprospiraceae bacterium]
MKLRILSIVCSLLFLSQNVWSQFTLSGKIVDNENQPIEFVTVFLKLKNNASAITKGTISENNGTFLIENIQAGSYSLSISFVGYAETKQELEITESTDLGIITLAPSENVLEELTVTADREIIERKGGKLLFNVSTSPLKSGYDGMEVLERSPNILIDGDAILMRNENAIVMINGRISNLSGANLANYIRNLQSDEIKTIEIKNHQSANTGAENAGGVINIILKKKPIGFDATVRSDYTFKSEKDFIAYSGLNLNYGAQKWNVYGSYNYLFNKSTSNTIATIDYFESGNELLETGIWKGDRKRHTYQMGFVADAIENHVFGIEAYGSNFINDFNNRNQVELSNQDNLLNNGNADLDGITDADLYYFLFNYTWTLDSLNSNLKFFADYSNQNFVGETQNTSDYEQATLQGITERNSTLTETDIYSIQTDLEKFLPAEIKLITGMKWTFVDRFNDLQSDSLFNMDWLDNGRTRAFNYGEKVLAGYVSMDKTFNEKHYVEVGVRVENTDLERNDFSQDTIFGQNYTNWFPSVYYSRDLPKRNKISFSYSKRLRRPPFQFLNNYVVKLNDFRYELGNPNLRPEIVHNTEVSFKQKKQSISAYYQIVKEAINGIYYLENQASFYRKFNAGSQTQYGLEYNRFGNLYEWWYLKVYAGLYNRKYTDEDGNDSFERVSGVVSISNNFKINKTTNLDFSLYYRSPFEDAFYIESEVYRANVMLQKNFFDKKLTCRIYFNDIFNTLIYNNERPFTTFKSTNSFNPQTQTLRLWLTYNFSNKSKVNKRKNSSKNDARRRL